MITKFLTRILAFSLSITVAACFHSGNDHTPEPEPGPQPEPEPAAWELVWSDEFDTGIDSGKWGFEINCSGGGNNEQQCYTDRSENAFVDNGALHIVAKEENYSGPALQDENPNYDPDDTSAVRNYTSARMRSRNLFDFTYGRIEIRAQLPGGQGAWPALWMLPTESIYGGWPSSGEIDIMEAVNLNTAATNEVHGTLHYGLPWPQWSNHGMPFDGDYDYTGEYHVYTLEWEANEMRWFVDGVHYQTQTSAGWYNYIWQGEDTGFAEANPQAPYDQNFHILMNLAIGGDWPGAPDTGWSEDREFLIDYVRVYQCDSGTADGSGCASASDPIDTSVTVFQDAGAPQINDFSFFDGANGSFTLDINSTPEIVVVVANVWQETAGNVLSTTTDVGGDNGEVWDITFNGLGNVFLSVDQPVTDGFENAISLSGGTAWTTNGELSFDLYVDNVDASTGFLVKLDSAYPNLGQVEIDLPSPGEWTRVHIRIADLLANPLAGGAGLNINNIANVFVLEPTGTYMGRLMIDNIQLQCAVNPTAQSWQSDKECGIAPVTTPSAPFSLRVDLFEDGVNSDIWDIGYQEFSTTGDHITESEVDLGAGDIVLDLLYNSDGADGVAWIAASTPQNLSAFEYGGALKLDVNVLSWGSSTSNLMLKVECQSASCTSGDYALGNQGALGTNTWNEISVPVMDLLNNTGSNLDLSQVANGLVIYPAWGDSQGVHFQINNARYEFDFLSIFEEQITNWDLYDCCGGTTINILTDPVDAGRGNVVEFSYTSDTTVTYFQSTAPLDLSAWAGGTIEFDLYIESEPTSAQWMMKVECEFPCSTGDVPLSENLNAITPTLGAWQHYVFDLDDLVTRGLQLNHVNTPLVIFPAWGNQAGAVFRVDNVKLIKAI